MYCAAVCVGCASVRRGAAETAPHDGAFPCHERLLVRYDGDVHFVADTIVKKDSRRSQCVEQNQAKLAANECASVGPTLPVADLVELGACRFACVTFDNRARAMGRERWCLHSAAELRHDALVRNTAIRAHPELMNAGARAFTLARLSATAADLEALFVDALPPERRAPVYNRADTETQCGYTDTRVGPAANREVVSHGRE